MNLKGIALLHMGQFEEANKIMPALAAYTEKHFARILFFFDLNFVEAMIERRLELLHCHAYLKTLSQRRQSIHDQKNLSPFSARSMHC